ncbi:hypothetical protein C8K63_107146 [Pseudomonas sp. GV085]|nr:hypothetical protein C8K63_107146 [Pseudomonas sp. GV085]
MPVQIPGEPHQRLGVMTRAKDHQSTLWRDVFEKDLDFIGTASVNHQLRLFARKGTAQITLQGVLKRLAVDALTRVHKGVQSHSSTDSHTGCSARGYDGHQCCRLAAHIPDGHPAALATVIAEGDPTETVGTAQSLPANDRRLQRPPRRAKVQRHSAVKEGDPTRALDQPGHAVPDGRTAAYAAYWIPTAFISRRALIVS